MNGIKISIEIGHESALKAKPTPDGFTHDWELFVRSCHSHEISHFIDKVVFNLHDSFVKPKRAIKEPPYVVKESGYAGFDVIVDIYVKNRDEPKKISFHYDMDLQNSGPSICRTQTFTHTFFNPSEEFRRKLLKGGGVNVCNTSLVNNFDEKSRERTISSAVPTPASSATQSSTAVATTMNSNGDVVKSSSSGKHGKSREPVNSEFANLFGTPITKTASLKVSPDPKAHRKASPNRAAGAAGSSSAKGPSTSSSSSSTGGKGEKNSTSTSSSSKEKNSSSSSRSRNTTGSPHVDRTGEKYDRSGQREDKGKRERNRSRERDSTKGSSSNNNNNSNNSGGSSSSSKEKSQKRRPSSPKYSPSVNNSSKSRSPPRGSSDYQSKGASSSSTSAATTTSTGVGAASTTNNNTTTGSGSKKSSKKEKKDKSHDKERGATGSATNATAGVGPTTTDHQSRDQQSKKDRDSGGGKRDGSSNSKSNDSAGGKYSTGGSREEKTAASSANKKEEKRVSERESGAAVASASSPLDSSKKHKHKKKDKEKGKGKDVEGKVQSPASQMLGTKGAMTPPNALTAATSSGAKEKKPRDRGTFASNSPAGKTIVSGGGATEKDISHGGGSNKAALTNSNNNNSSNLSDSEENEQLAQPLLPDEAYPPKPVGGKTAKKSEKGEKRKRRGKDDLSDGEVPPEKKKRKGKEDLSDGASPNKMPPSRVDSRSEKRADSRLGKRGSGGGGGKNGSESSLENPPGTNHVNSIYNHARLSEPEYIQELKLLQHKIMTLQDSSDLQQVVEIIAVTGQYEITESTRTFDFDLCVLNAETVQRLKDFFHVRAK